MAILASLFAVAGRFLGRALTMALGWASILLFGRVPESKQTLLAAISFGSLAWLVAVVGVALPDVGTFLLAAVPAPDWVPEAWVRLAMLAAVLLVPPLIGIGSIVLLDAGERPGGAGLVAQVLRGYPYAAVLALTIAFMALVAPALKLRSLARRWQDAHIPVVIRPGGYERVARDVERALDEAGLAVERRTAPRVLEVPSKLLEKVAGRGIASLVPDRLIVLAGPNLEVLLYPSDVNVAGKRAELARARAAIASRLTFSAAYLTTTRESQAIEERLERLVGLARLDGTGAAVETELADIDRALAALTVAYDEWEVLYRLRLQVERDLLRGSLPAVAASEPPPVIAPRVRSHPGERGRLGEALGAGIAGVAVAILRLVSRRTARRNRNTAARGRSARA
ncbi:MAG TPA: hypothetical protein VFK38_04325 [Candidatus Limnocylindrales bacterium]|nr:hypothetical protein [Candidatus Limnocylindrales bacterium]